MGTLEEQVADLKKEVAALAATVRRLTPRESGWIPPHATVAAGVSLAANVALVCREPTPIQIGEGTKIYRNTEILGPVTIGNRCLVNRDGYIRPQTTIEDDVYIGPFVKVITDGHHIGGPNKRAGANQVKPVTIGAGTWVGANSTILGGVTIGPGCIVAAGSLVNKNIPANTLVGGVPAKVIRSLDSAQEREAASRVDALG